MKQVLVIPQSARDIVEKYQTLPIGRSQVVCPYFMNLKKQRAGLRVLVGKGAVDEIVHEVKVWAKVKGFDINNSTDAQIREFMIQGNIGIDCSGFVTYILNGWLKAEGKGTLIGYLQFPDNGLISRLKRKLRPVERIGAELMTSDTNCERITDLNKIRPGDMLRSKGKVKNSHHVSLISKVVLEGGVIKEFEYVHSMRYYEDQNGIKYGKVIVTDPSGELKDQDWQEVLDGKNWTYEGLMNSYEDNGIRRLKQIELGFEGEDIT